MLKEIILGSIVGIVIFCSIQGYNIFPIVVILLLIGFLLFLLKKNNILNFNADQKYACQTEMEFSQIGGLFKAKRELIEALDFIVEEKSISRLGIRPIKGLLLTGPPGTGKTLLAKAAASYTDSVFLSASGSEFIEMYAGVGAQRIRSLFKKATETALNQKKNRAVIFIDEIEVLGCKRGQNSNHMEYDQTLNELLVKMDGLNKIDENLKILIMGATNRVDLIDEALLRPGRFDRIVQVDLPDKEARYQILKIHTANKPLTKNLDLKQIAAETFGFSGAHLESVANEAAILALRENSIVIENKHFNEAIDKVMLGEKTDRKLTAEERYRIAIHETGHALISEHIKPQSVSHVTITPRSNALGYLRQKPKEDSHLYTKEQIENQIKILLAGASAEEIVFGSKSTGASNDYKKALQLAKDLVFNGMSNIGIVCTEDLNKNLLVREYQTILKKQEKDVFSVLNKRKNLLVTLGNKLLKDESIMGEQLTSFINQSQLN